MYSIITILQGGEFPFFANSLFDLSLKIAHFKELLRANGSHRSLQKSESLFRSQKTNDSLEKPKSEFPTMQFRMQVPVLWELYILVQCLSDFVSFLLE